MGCGGNREVGGSPPPDFEVLRELDRTPDPACEGVWVAAVRGRVVDVTGSGVMGARPQQCLRVHDGRFVCTVPGEADAEGWYAQVFGVDNRCLDALAVRALLPGGSLSTTYCHVPLEPEDGVLLIPHPTVLHALEAPTDRPDLGDPTAARDVRFAGGVVLTHIVPDSLFDSGYEDLAAGLVPVDSRPCYLSGLTDAEREEVLGIVAFAPEVRLDTTTPVGLVLPNDQGLAEGTKVVLHILGGLETILIDGTQVPEADLVPFGTATVTAEGIVSDEDIAVPALTTIVWRRAPVAAE